MHNSVRDGVFGYLKFFEGSVEWMYLDSVGLVTTGIGTLLDPFDKFWQDLPFHYKSSGKAATKDEIKAEFNKVKARQDLATKRYTVFEPLTELRVTDIDKRVQKDVAGKETYVRGLFGSKAYDGWPADAQLAVLSIVYGAGSLKDHPRLIEACKERDWWGARLSGMLSNPKQGVEGYISRNTATIILFQNAFVVDKCRELGKKPFDDVSILWGLKQALSCRSWNMNSASAPNVTKNDMVSAQDLTNWVKNRKSLTSTPY